MTLPTLTADWALAASSGAASLALLALAGLIRLALTLMHGSTR